MRRHARLPFEVRLQVSWKGSRGQGRKRCLHEAQPPETKP